eukprot:ANDGO_02940.mRNA.1 BBSome-interacting protein 1
MSGVEKTPAEEALPRSGIVYSERSNMTEIMCKPKVMPIKSVTLEKLEQMEKQMLRAGSQPQQDSNGFQF